MADTIAPADTAVVETDPTMGIVLTVVRYLVSMLGAFFVRKGYATNDDVLTVTAAVVALVPMVMAAVAKKRAVAHTVEVASLPTSAITFK